MDSQDFTLPALKQIRLKMQIGKRVVDDLYAHLSCVDEPEFHHQRDRITAALKAICTTLNNPPNVFKINNRTDRLSLLTSVDFEESAFPELAESWTFGPGRGGWLPGRQAGPPLQKLLMPNASAYS